ncbi:MAG: type II toxin-antitoxin system VapC family toxin [Deltaproteobacteria bacterium]|nr:type II toxin-antitoxin system VapC family toxin [Deltaproteobacteria bacterium]
MRTVVLDTNVLLRLVHAGAPDHRICRSAVQRLARSGSTLAVPIQVAVEFWVVATRPADVNGLGWSASVARAKLDQILSRLVVLPEPPAALEDWLEVVTTTPVVGKRAHDARIASAMRVNGVSHLLTLNTSDFAGIPGIVPVHPSALE